MDPVSIGKALKAHRVAAGLSLRGLAEKSGVDFTTISHIEAGRKNPTIELLNRLTQGLGITIEHLWQEPKELDFHPVVQRFAEIAPSVPQADIDVFVHMLELWEQRYGQKP